jgi:hypothetical protein
LEAEAEETEIAAVMVKTAMTVEVTEIVAVMVKAAVVIV